MVEIEHERDRRDPGSREGARPGKQRERCHRIRTQALQPLGIHQRGERCELRDGQAFSAQLGIEAGVA